MHLQAQDLKISELAATVQTLSVRGDMHAQAAAARQEVEAEKLTNYHLVDSYENSSRISSVPTTAWNVLNREYRDQREDSRSRESSIDHSASASRERVSDARRSNNISNQSTIGTASRGGVQAEEDSRRLAHMDGVQYEESVGGGMATSTPSYYALHPPTTAQQAIEEKKALIALYQVRLKVQSVLRFAKMELYPSNVPRNNVTTLSILFLELWH